MGLPKLLLVAAIALGATPSHAKELAPKAARCEWNICYPEVLYSQSGWDCALYCTGGGGPCCGAYWCCLSDA